MQEPLRKQHTFDGSLFWKYLHLRIVHFEVSVLYIRNCRTLYGEFDKRTKG